MEETVKMNRRSSSAKITRLFQKDKDKEKEKETSKGKDANLRLTQSHEKKEKKEKEKEKEKEFDRSSLRKTVILTDQNAIFDGTSVLFMEHDKIDILYRKAFNSLSLKDIFKYFAKLIKQKNKIKYLHEKKKLETKEAHQEDEIYHKRIIKFLSLLIQYRKSLFLQPNPFQTIVDKFNVSFKDFNRFNLTLKIPSSASEDNNTTISNNSNSNSDNNNNNNNEEIEIYECNNNSNEIQESTNNTESSIIIISDIITSSNKGYENNCINIIEQNPISTVNEDQKEEDREAVVAEMNETQSSDVLQSTQKPEDTITQKKKRRVAPRRNISPSTFPINNNASENNTENEEGGIIITSMDESQFEMPNNDAEITSSDIFFENNNNNNDNNDSNNNNENNNNNGEEEDQQESKSRRESLSRSDHGISRSHSSDQAVGLSRSTSNEYTKMSDDEIKSSNRNSSSVGEVFDYSSVFYYYLSSKEMQEYNILQPQMMQHYIKALSHFIYQKKLFKLNKSNNMTSNYDISSLVSKTNSSNDDEILVEAKMLLKYLESHQIDPYNSLIGIPPSNEIINNLHLSSTSLLSINPTNQNLRLKQKDKTKSQGNNDEDEDDFYHKNNLILDPKEMYSHIINWAISDESDETIVNNIRKYAAILRGVTSLQLGEIVIVRVKKNKFRFGRYSGAPYNPNTNSVDVVISPTDETSTPTPIDRIFPLPFYYLKKIMSGDMKSYEKLIYSPFDLLFNYIMKISHDFALGKMKELGISTELISKCKLNQCSLLDTEHLNESLQAITKFQEEIAETAKTPESDVLLPLYKDFYEYYQKFVRKLKEKKIILFQENIQQIYSQIVDLPSNISRFVLMEFIKHKGIMESSVDQINLQKKELMMGERKQMLTEWWLSVIRSSVYNKLRQLNYNETAIPNNYTSEAPKDFRKVRFNAKLFREILDLDSDIHNFREVIDQLKAVIYPKISAFITDSLILLFQTLKFDVTEERLNNANLDDLSAKFEAKHAANTISDQTYNWATGAIKDIDYLIHMQKLESSPLSFFPATEHSKLVHIVPVSGLAISIVCRLENEHKTAMEMWAPLVYLRKLSVDILRFTPIHRAISSGDVKKFRALLKEGVDINEQDSNGWTPLHCATAAEANFDMGSELLGIEGILVNEQNIDGNSPLHLLSRCYAADSAKQISLLKLILEKGGDVNLGNNNGETPLHVASFLGHLEIAKILISNDADPNSLTLNGESCLYYAVQGRQKDLVQLLIDNGAAITTENEKFSPLALSIKHHYSDIIEVFERHKSRKKTLLRKSIQSFKKNF